MPQTAHPAASDPQIVSTRLIPVPRDLVFRAFVQPDVLTRWWGPAGFTNTFEVFEPRAGGAWRFVMRAPDGAEYAMVKQFVDVAPPDRIVLRQIGPVHGFVMTMTFADEAGGTRLTWVMRFGSPAEADAVRAFIVTANEQNFDRLEAELRATAT